MPSPITHLSAGIIIYRCLPAEQRAKFPRRIWRIPLLALILMVVSLLPDLDFILGLLRDDIGAYHNQASHSLITGMAVALVLGLGLRWWLKGTYLFWFGLLFVTYTAHILLDMLTHGRGNQLFWPLSTQRFISPILLFYGFRWARGLWSISHIWTFISELMFWGAVFGLAHLLPKITSKKKTVNHG
jgi:membrane-bound metal-dependent hydrolase YbcI (DUF457 family)